MMAMGIRLILPPCRGSVVRQGRYVSAKKCSRKQGGSLDVLVSAYLSTGANAGVFRDVKRVRGHDDAALNTKRKAVMYDTLVDMHLATRDLFSRKPLFGTKVVNSTANAPGMWKWITYKEFGENVDAVRAVLSSKGIKPGDVVGCISNNRKEWAESAYATYSLGGTFVAMYEDQRPKDWKYILKDSGVKLLFVSTPKIYKQTFHYPGIVGAVENVISFDERGIEARYTLPSLMRESRSDVPPIIPHPDHLANIVYTSGTTGDPKGVELTHRNTMATIWGIQDRLPQALGSDDQTLSFLPWAHCYGQSCELHIGMYYGASMAISQGVDKLKYELLETRPTVLLSVPALYKRIFDGIHDKVHESSALKRYLFTKALKVAHHCRKHEDSGMGVSPIARMQHALLDKLFLSKVRAVFGGNLRMALVGGAAMPSCIHSFFENAGIPVLMGYGLTESTLVSLNGTSPKDRHIGSSGNILSNLTVKIIQDGVEVPEGEEGEVCVSGPTVMKCYHNNVTATNEVMMQYKGASYFRTGDLGKFQKNSGGNELFITGRLKEQFKLENGKYVVPGPLEVAMTQSNFIFQVLLYGDNEPFCVGLIVPDWERVRKWAINEGYASKHTTREELMNDEYVNNLIGCEIDTVLDGFKSYEKPKKFMLITEEFTKERGLLSQKMSIKRNAVIKEYREFLRSMYVGEIRHHREYGSDDDDAELVMSG